MSVDIINDVLTHLASEIRGQLDPSLNIDVSGSGRSRFDYIDVFHIKAGLNKIGGKQVICRVEYFQNNIYIVRNGIYQDIIIPLADPDCFQKVINIAIRLVEVSRAQQS